MEENNTDIEAVINDPDKTDKQEESAFIVFWSIIVGGILLAGTIIAQYL